MVDYTFTVYAGTGVSAGLIRTSNGNTFTSGQWGAGAGPVTEAATFTGNGQTTITVVDDDGFFSTDGNSGGSNETSLDGSQQTIGGVSAYIDYSLTYTYMGVDYTLYSIDIGTDDGTYFFWGDGLEPPTGVDLGIPVYDPDPNVPYPCFVKGTMIRTGQGYVRVEDLQVGDLVVTRDNGLQPVRWIGSRKVGFGGRYDPICFPAGTLGNSRDLLVSPHHRMLIGSPGAGLLFGEDEVLVCAKDLLGLENVHSLRNGRAVCYYHILFDTHQIIDSEGAWSESFHPQAAELDSFDTETRDEILALFPELGRDPQHGYGLAARRSLRRHEAQILVPLGEDLRCQN